MIKRSARYNSERKKNEKLYSTLHTSCSKCHYVGLILTHVHNGLFEVGYSGCSRSYFTTYVWHSFTFVNLKSRLCFNSYQEY